MREPAARILFVRRMYVCPVTRVDRSREADVALRNRGQLRLAEVASVRAAAPLQSRAPNSILARRP